MLAASGSGKGASNAIFTYAPRQQWQLLSSPYAFNEVDKNLPKLDSGAADTWAQLRQQVNLVEDIVSLDRPVIFAASKDRPILFTGLAWADVLLTLDKTDFSDILGTHFYGLPILLPYIFLKRERHAGRL